MAKRELTSKEKAFEKEKDKFRHEINELKNEIKSLKSSIKEKDLTIEELNNALDEQKEWIERLLEYMSLDEYDLGTIKETIKQAKGNQEKINKTLGLLELMNQVIGVR